MKKGKQFAILDNATPDILYDVVRRAKDFSDKKYDNEAEKVKRFLEDYKILDNYKYCDTIYALQRYAKHDPFGLGGHTQINKLLRGEDPNFIRKEQENNVRKIINTITRVLDDYKLPCAMNLYRGMGLLSLSDLFGDAWDGKPLQEYKGKIFCDNGFCSTTTSREKAYDFTKLGTLMEIIVPKGANGILMGIEYEDNEEGISPKSEREVLLQRCSCFKIIEIEKVNNVHIIKAQLIGRNECVDV